MKKAVFVAWCLPFYVESVWGMPENREGSDRAPLLGELRGDLVINSSTKSDEKNVRKRKLSHSSEGDREIRRRYEKKEDTTERQVTDLERLVGLRKRIERKEKENESLSREIKEQEGYILVLEQQKEEQNKEIKEQEGQILSLERKNADLSQSVEEKELIVRTVNDYLDSSMERCERQTIIDQISAELWRRCGTNVVEKMKVLIPAIISKVVELKMENIENKKEIRSLQSDLQELQKKDNENKAGMKSLQDQIDQLKQGFQNQENRVGQSAMDIDEGRSNVIRSESVNNFHEQRLSFNIRNVMTYSFRDNDNRNVAQEIRADNEKQVRGNRKILANKRLGAELKGCFVGGYLDFSVPVRFKGCYVEEQEFCFSGEESGRLNFISNSKKIKISEEDFFNMDEVRPIQDLLSVFLSKTGRGFVFGKELVYQGEVDVDGKPINLGIMLRSTGEVREGSMSTEDWLRR